MSTSPRSGVRCTTAFTPGVSSAFAAQLEGRQDWTGCNDPAGFDIAGAAFEPIDTPVVPT